MKRALVLAAALLVIGEAAAAPPRKAERGPSVAVRLMRLQKGSLPRTVTAYGTVGTGPATRQTIQAPVGAVVEAVYVKPGERVSARAPLVRLEPSPATAASYAQAIAALRAANEEVHRTRSLVRQHLATRQRLAAAEKSAADARAALAALQSEGAGGAQTLRAPFPAIVTAVSTSPGAIVARGAALFDLARPSGLVLHAAVVPSRAIEISTGDAANILPLGEKRRTAGRVLLRGSVVDSRTGLVAIDIALPENRFFAGEMAEAEIVIGTAAGYVVPHAAVLVNDQGAPYVVQAVGGRARLVRVRILLDNGSREVIAGPLDPAAPLILAGNYQLRNGMKIRAAAPSGAKGG